MKNVVLILICLGAIQLSAFCQQKQVDTILVGSVSMAKPVKNVIILPEQYSITSSKNYPVLYLLHGYSGNYASWISLKPDLSKLATIYEMIIVCPDGQNSWYWDSPTNPKVRYETYVSKELIDYVDKNYRTIKNSKGRAITGLSMGGHGGLWLGIRHQDVFGACGSMSGGLDIRPFPEYWEMKTQLGEYASNETIWDNHTVINQLHKVKAGELAIIIDCGKDDFFYDVNQALHDQMLYMRIPHDYTIRPGQHDGPYWENAIEYQLIYFSKYFKQ